MRIAVAAGKCRCGRLLAGLFCFVFAVGIAVPVQAQNGQKEMVRICLPRDLVERESWENAIPGSRMASFRNLVRDYLLEHGDVRSQYRVREGAFASFEPGRSTPRDILQVVSANQECPPSNYTYELDVSLLDGGPSRQQAAQSVPSEAGRNALYRGWQYQVGKGVTRDPATAARLYEEAAKQGLPEAMYRLGLLYLDGEGVQQNSNAAVYWFYQAGQRGHPEAQAEVGYALFEGQGAQQNEKAASEWLLAAARAGVSRAQCAVGILYEGGAGVTKDASQAVEWFRKAAEQGEVYAMHRLGVHFREGQGVAWSEAEAMRWFRKAADKGFALSQSSLGWGYMKGLGQDVGQGVQDYRQAAYWFDLAARQGEPHAQVNLGLFYESGWGVEKNLPRAKALYIAAANGPDPKVAGYAKTFAEGLPDAPYPETSVGRQSSSSGDSVGGWIAAGFAVAGGIALLKMLFSSDSSASHAAAPGSSEPSTSTEPWSSGTDASPPTQNCRTVPVNNFSILNGTDMTSPTGATTLVCD